MSALAVRGSVINGPYLCDRAEQARSECERVAVGTQRKPNVPTMTMESKPSTALSSEGVDRSPPLTPAVGLTDAEVADRVARDLVNVGGERPSRSVREILRANILTRFNFILGSLFVIIVIVGEPQDALFGIVVVGNALIGIIQELRAKRTLDRLAVLNAPRVQVVRNGEATEIGVESLVRDDLIVLRGGDQIVVDGQVRVSEGLQVDESLLTGESQPVDKAVDDFLLSGSFVSSGSGRLQATAVGAQAYAWQLAAEARQFQGLVLLTSVAFGVAAVDLARHQVLVQ